MNTRHEEIKSAIDSIKGDLLDSIKELVSIYSIQGVATEDAPYGIGPKKALLKALEISEKLGFKTKNIDNKIGYAQYGEDVDDKYFGVFGHVDVVPIGKGWKYEPLGLEIENNRIHGRGVLDNKAPILSNLYALYILKELGVKFDIPVRIVFGSNEETGFGCVKHYVKKEPAPVFGWTPDCKWPVVYGERGRLKLRIYTNKRNSSEMYKYLNSYILGAPSNGIKLGVNYSDDDFGEMVIRDHSIGETEDEIYFELVLCYPSSCTKDVLVRNIEKTLPSIDGFRIEIIHNWDTILYDKNSEYVKILQKVYNKITGLDAVPVTTTGGTYAKIIPNIIAFGPSFPNQKNIAHLPDEWYDLNDMVTNMQIYAISMYELSKLKY